ncbi:Glutaredoxin-C9 [Capsicum baccatum]|uniref:Glutaredoxin-C9 n=1 Tax=Capsicum baccatum TaxID=33114 RepID=A0A2G2XEH8_CAPBA|nr:Glutaredoxin-C9 [Capsicum baccatum]
MDRTSARRSSVAPAVGGSSSGGSGTPSGHPSNRTKRKAKTGFAKLIGENAVLIISMSECCMCVIVKSLLVSLGVNPKVFNVDEEEKTSVLMKLSKMNEGASSGTGGPWELPAVYIGGKYLGGVDKVMESHINGELVPMLREVGALWL